MVTREAWFVITLIMFLTDKSTNLLNLSPCTVPKKDVFLVLPFLGSQSEVLPRRVKFCVSRFYGFVNLRAIFNNTCRIMSFFPYKNRFSRSKRSKVVYKVSCWDCGCFYVGKTKHMHDCDAYAVADNVISTGHNIKWTILKSSPLESPTYSVKLKELFWSVSWNPHVMKTLVVRSYFFINFYR